VACLATTSCAHELGAADQLISICCGRDSQELSTHTGPEPACLLSLTRTRSLRPYISSTIPFSFIFLWTLLRVFALTKNSTPLFWNYSALFTKNTGWG